MSERKSVEELPVDGEQFDVSKISKLLNLLLCVGIGAVALLVALYALNGSWRGMIAYSWLFAFIFFFTLGLGGVFWTLLHNATNSGWGVSVRRLMENLGLMMPWLALVALPMFIFPTMRDALWEWIPMQAELTERADTYASENLDHYEEEWRHEMDAAQSSFDAEKTRIDAAMADATPGERAFLEEKIGNAGARLDEVKDARPTRESVVQHKLAHDDVLLYGKRPFLNTTFWILRTTAYFVILCGIIFVLRGWSVRQDYTGDLKFTRWARRAACGFLPLFAVATTFAVVDWLMALDYAWFSTMWGVYLFAGSAWASMALLIIVLTWLRNLGYLKDVVTMEHYHVMGKLLLAFTIFWAYISFSQYFLIWYANITEETKFFLMRNTGPWNSVSITLVIFHFFVPFLMLLQRGVKKKPRVLSAIAVYVLVMHVLDMYWIVIPERGPSLGHGVMSQGAFIFDLIALVGIGSLLAYVFLKSFANDSLYPCRDPRLEESVNLAN